MPWKTDYQLFYMSTAFHNGLVEIPDSTSEKQSIINAKSHQREQKPFYGKFWISTALLCLSSYSNAEAMLMQHSQYRDYSVNMQTSKGEEWREKQMYQISRNHDS